MMRGLLHNRNNQECEEMSSLKQNHTILEENVRLKQDKEILEKKFNDLLFMVSDKMNQMISILNEIKNKEVIVNQVISEKSESKKVMKEERTKMFIPTPDSSNLKSNISDLQKTIRKTDLDSSVSELSKLQDKSGK